VWSAKSVYSYVWYKRTYLYHAESVSIQCCFPAPSRSCWHGDTSSISPNKNEMLLWRTNRLRHGPHRKRCLQQLFVAMGTSLPRYYLTTTEGYTDPQTHASNNSSIVACILCRGKVFTEPFPSTDRRDTHRDTQPDGRDLWSTPLRRAQVPWYTYQIS
jgi:hypothetical protein